jgi:hypothetical protein
MANGTLTSCAAVPHKERIHIINRHGNLNTMSHCAGLCQIYGLIGEISRNQLSVA